MLVERPCKSRSSEPNLCVLKITGCLNTTDVSTHKSAGCVSDTPASYSRDTIIKCQCEDWLN
jgi:hypothetical protein